VFALVIASIVAWVVLGRPTVADDGVAARSTPVAVPSAAPTTDSPAEAPVDAPAETAPETPAPMPEVAPAPTAAPIPMAAAHPPVETAFLDEVADSGLAPPVPDEAQLQMAREICQAFDQGATFQVLVDTFVNMGATRAEADSFVGNAATSFCPQHAPSDG
jgi:hypothetical protein